jgi:hypothetical protein
LVAAGWHDRWRMRHLPACHSVPTRGLDGAVSARATPGLSTAYPAVPPRSVMNFHRIIGSLPQPTTGTAYHTLEPMPGLHRRHDHTSGLSQSRRFGSGSTMSGSPLTASHRSTRWTGREGSTIDMIFARNMLTVLVPYKTMILMFGVKIADLPHSG